MTEVCVRLKWQRLGSLSLTLGKLAFPAPPAEPGVFRFDIQRAGEPATSYIGQTDFPPRRFGNYRNPGGRQQTNIRMNAVLTQAHTRGATVEVSVAVDGELSVGGQQVPLTMYSKAHRLLPEGAAVVVAGTDGVLLANL